MQRQKLRTNVAVLLLMDQQLWMAEGAAEFQTSHDETVTGQQSPRAVEYAMVEDVERRRATGPVLST